MQKFIDRDGLKVLWKQASLQDYPNNETLMAVIDAIDETKANKEHTHTIESIDGLQDAVNAAADSKFYVVTFDKGSDGKYHGDLTFAEIREKFEAGGNMVARIDGTDYIPLLSAATHQIIFSGIYQSQSVSLTIDSNDVCTLTTTSLARNQHSHSNASTSANGFMSSTDKVKLNEIESGAEVNLIESISVNGEELSITDKSVNIEIPIQVQPDWNQNDETAADYIKNRPFYEHDVTLLDNVTVNNGDTLNMDTFVEGDTVIITWDGVASEKTVGYCDVVSGRFTALYFTIGNQSYLNDAENTFEDTGEGYLIKYLDDIESPEITINCNDESHTLSVLKKDVIVEIEDKYLPNIWKGTGDGALVLNDKTNIASKTYSLAEGNNTTASGDYGSHAEGNCTTASGDYGSHAEGYHTTTSGYYGSHAEGCHTTASGNYGSHAEGDGTVSSSDSQHVQGKYNIEDTEGKYAHIVGNGDYNHSRSNAHTLDWEGNAEYAGDVIANACGGESPISLVEIAEKVSVLDEVDLSNVVYYEEVTEETEIDIIKSLCFDQLSLSYDGATLYLNFGNTILSQVDIATETIACTGISLDTTEINVTDAYIGISYTLTPTLLPNNCTQKVKWSTDNESVATVSEGIVTLTGCGNATITATCGSHSATCNVVVKSTVVDVEIINGIYNTGTDTVSYVNSSSAAVTNPFVLKLDSDIDYTVSMNNSDYNIMIVGYDMTDGETDYYIDNVGQTETFAGTLTYWGGWTNADGTVYEINKSSCPYLQVLIQKADSSAITNDDLQTIKNALVIKKIYGDSEIGISFGINASWNASGSNYTMTLSENATRGYSKYNGRNTAILVEPLTTYTIDFSSINDSNYIIGIQFSKSDGVKVSDRTDGWKDTQAFTFTTPAEVVCLFLNFKYGEDGTTTITEAMAEALTNAITMGKVVE